MLTLMMLVIRCLARLSTSGSYQITTTCAGIPHSSSGDLTCGSTFTGDTTGAAHVVGSSSGEHFYRLAVTAPTEYTFSTCEGSAYDTRLRLYSGDHLASSSTELANVDDACSLQSLITRMLEPGAYTLIVEGFSSNEGTATSTVASTALAHACLICTLPPKTRVRCVYLMHCTIGSC